MPRACPYDAAGEGELGRNAGGVSGRTISKLRLASCKEPPLIARRSEGVGETWCVVRASDPAEPAGSLIVSILLDLTIAALTGVSRFCNFGLSVSGIWRSSWRLQLNVTSSVVTLC